MTFEKEFIFENTEEINLVSQILEDNNQEESENFLKNSIEEIEKIDALLKIKENEEKKIRLIRVQVEEEFRNILSKLQKAEVPVAISNNCSEFINLINKQNKLNLDSNKESSKDIPILKEETEKIKSLKTRHTFIERNIQLAKCGRGTLSMTEEEQLRIKNLLESETEGPESEKSQPREEMIYGFENESQSKLAQIDEQLALMSKRRSLEKDSEDNLKLESTPEVKEENVKNKHSRKNRLKEIDSLLGSMTSASPEEITPLPQPDIENLIRQATLSERPDQICSEPKIEDPQNNIKSSSQLSSCKPLNEVISGLVQNAKSLMPKFKYRYGEY